MSRELDTEIAEKIMGWKWIDYRWYDGSTKRLLWHTDNGSPEGDDFGRLGDDASSLLPWDMPAYSTDIAAAWEVVERLTSSDGPHADLKWSFGLEYSSVVDWVCDFTPRRNHPKAREYPAFQASGITASEAICRAALKTIE